MNFCYLEIFSFWKSLMQIPFPHCTLIESLFFLMRFVAFWDKISHFIFWCKLWIIEKILTHQKQKFLLIVLRQWWIQRRQGGHIGKNLEKIAFFYSIFGKKKKNRKESRVWIFRIFSLLKGFSGCAPAFKRAEDGTFFRPEMNKISLNG